MYLNLLYCYGKWLFQLSSSALPTKILPFCGLFIVEQYVSSNRTHPRIEQHDFKSKSGARNPRHPKVSKSISESLFLRRSRSHSSKRIMTLNPGRHPIDSSLSWTNNLFNVSDCMLASNRHSDLRGMRAPSGRICVGAPIEWFGTSLTYQQRCCWKDLIGLLA